MKRFKISGAQIIAVGTLFMLIGVGILLSGYFFDKKSALFELINMQFYFNQIDGTVIEDEPEVEEPNSEPEQVEEKEEQQNVVTENYIGILEIPKIELKKGFYDINSRLNKVSRNVSVLKPSDYPDVDKGNLVLAAHSGNGYVSFFKNLYKLVVGDYAYVYYNNVKYTYKINYIYNQEKTGTINVYRPYNQTTLMLVTCTKNDESSQTVYVLVLENKEPY